MTSAADFTKGAGPFSVYHNLTLSDGSVLWFKVNAMAKPNGPDTDFTGTLTVLGGKGRFEGAKGDGYFTGARLTPLTTGAEAFNDFTVNIKK